MSSRLNGIWPSLLRFATSPSFENSTRRTTLSQAARRTYASSTSHNVPSRSPDQQGPSTLTYQRQERARLPVVVVKTRTGRDAEVHFNPVPGTDLMKLRASLQSLISFPSNLGPERKPTFGSRTWIVSPQYNAVYRKIAVATDGVLSRILSQIKEAADEMDHHPIIVEIGKKAPFRSGKRAISVRCIYV